MTGVQNEEEDRLADQLIASIREYYQQLCCIMPDKFRESLGRQTDLGPDYLQAFIAQLEYNHATFLTEFFRGINYLKSHGRCANEFAEELTNTLSFTVKNIREDFNEHLQGRQ